MLEDSTLTLNPTHEHPFIDPCVTHLFCNFQRRTTDTCVLYSQWLADVLGDHQTTECARCAVSECGMDTQRLSIPSTAVATRETITQRQSQSVKNVCAAQAHSRDPNHRGLTTSATALTNHCFEFDWRGRVQGSVRCAVKACSLSSLESPPLADHQRHSKNFARNSCRFIFP